MNTQTVISIPSGSGTMNELAAVRPGAGDHRFFLNHLGTVKIASDDSASGMGAVEFRAPRGFATPIHVHEDQDELLYVIDGEIRLGLGDEAVTVGSGTFVSLPRKIPHVFQVTSEEARFLSVTSGGPGGPTFDDFVVAMSEKVDPENMPAPTPVDPAHVATVGAAHGIQVLGPPPAPLD